MRWKRVIAICLWIVPSSVWAAEVPPPSTEITQVIKDALQQYPRTLKLPNAPPPYHILYQVNDIDNLEVNAAFGSIVSMSHHPYRGLGLTVRVGSPHFDNTGMDGWQNGFSQGGLTLGDGATPIAMALWRQTDRSYKHAVEHFARNQAQFTPPENHHGDYELMEPTIADDGIGVTQLPAESLVALAQDLSSVFINEGTFERGEVVLGREIGAQQILDSGGTHVRKPIQELSIRAIGSMISEDGMSLEDYRLWTVEDATQLPPVEVMKQRIEDMVDHLKILSQSPPFDEEYVGPVIFQDSAAISLFRYLLVPQLEGTPPPRSASILMGGGSVQEGSVRIGRRLLPDGWNVSDNPQADPLSPASFAFDAEGTPAQPVHLVSNGITQDLLMSRIPRKDIPHTNGHSRGQSGSRLVARASIMDIEAPKNRSRNQLYKKAYSLARAYGRDYFLVVRRLTDPAIQEFSDPLTFTLFPGDRGAEALPAPLAVVKRFSDGREVPYRNVSFSGIQRWLLRDILLAGPVVEETYLAPMYTQYGLQGPIEGLPTGLRAPEVLVGEVELLPRATIPSDLPNIPPPAPTK